MDVRPIDDMRAQTGVLQDVEIFGLRDGTEVP